MAITQVPTWEVSESGGFETSWVELSETALSAHGRVVGLRPAPYWLDYQVETGPVAGAAFATRRLRVTARTAAGTRRLDLRHEDGGWTVDGEPRPDLAGALDCDLGLSPLTNTMPVLRHRLHRAPGEREFLMAWVSVPDLTVRPSRQTYTHLGTTADGGGRARYASGAFRSDLTFDAAGLVVDYPGMARRHGEG